MHIRSVFGFALLALLLAGCGKSYSWYERLTILIETPAGPIELSGVNQAVVRYYPNGMWAAGTEVESAALGEAIFTLLPNGQYLFVLLRRHPSGAGVFVKPKDRSGTRFQFVERQRGK